VLSAGAYTAGVVELAVVLLAVGWASYRVRSRLLPAWAGAPARLVESVLGIAILIWLGEALGTVGLLEEAPLVVASLAVAAIVAVAARPARAPAGAPPAPATPDFAWLVAVALIAGIAFHWAFETKESLNDGIGNFDSLWYHMPFATEIAQSGSTTHLLHTETVFLNWFYPQNSELLHGIGLVLTDRDTLSLFINLGWLALTLLAAWCIGRPYGRGPLTLAAAAILVEADALVVREPGAAKNDLAAAALILAAAAILVNAWEARRRDGRGETGLEPGWALAAAGLAAGLAAGTKLTVLAAAAGLTVLAIGLVPRGARRVASAWWLLPVLAGGAYWYARNLVVAGNPIPQVTELGPLSLPGPERLQEGRPDFTVLHYATDTAVWSDYFAPGLNDALGVLWPLVIVAALAGALIALARGESRVQRWLGGVALFSMAAYLVTPLSAAGAEGAPTAFGINVRFAIPALLLGLCLLPLARAFDRRERWWTLLAALLAVLVVTDRSYDLLRADERLFGLVAATLLVLVPAALLAARRRRAPAALVAAGFAALGLLVAGLGYEVQRDYLRDRYAHFDPGSDLSRPYRWAADLSGRRIGLAGTTAGFLQYGLYGKRLQNELVYVGRDAPHGGFDAIPTCSEFRAAVNAERLDYLVTSPFLNFIRTGDPIRSPEASWLRGEPAVRPTLRDGGVTVWRVEGPLDPSGCGPRNPPLRYVQDQPPA
jgi:hypothetical protein